MADTLLQPGDEPEELRAWEAQKAQTLHRRALGLVLVGPVILSVGTVVIVALIGELLWALPDGFWMIPVLSPIGMMYGYGMLVQGFLLVLLWIASWVAYATVTSALLRLFAQRRRSVLLVHVGTLALVALGVFAPLLAQGFTDLRMASAVEAHAWAWPSVAEPWLVHVEYDSPYAVKTHAGHLWRDGVQLDPLTWSVGRETWLTVPDKHGAVDAVSVAFRMEGDGRQGTSGAQLELEPWPDPQPARRAVPDAEVPELEGYLPGILACFEQGGVRVPGRVILRSRQRPLLVLQRTEDDAREEATRACLKGLLGDPLGAFEPEKITVYVFFQLPEPMAWDLDSMTQ
ncbi:MAG: hypothetical protein H6739_08745 [Alphaproteobacteria bacterium]|nr:hypothetical protein [Alphaproteobacteria bacterium]